MNQNLLLHFFPIPRFLQMPAIGLDLSDRSIKFLELVSRRGRLSLGRFGEREVPAGVVESGLIKKPEELGKILSGLRSELALDYAAVSLPEEHAYLVNMKLAALPRRNLRQTIELSLEEHVPLSPSDVNFDYEVVSGGPESGWNLVVSVMPKKVVEGYLEAFQSAGFTITAFEIEAQSLARSIVPRESNSTFMIVDFGRMRTGFTICSAGHVWFTSTAAIGGDHVVKAVMEKIGLTEKMARLTKEKNGLSRSAGNREIFSAIAPVASALKEELEKHYLYWNTHPTETGEVRPTIEKIILLGGDANFPGLLDYLASSFEVEFLFANPWVNLIKSFDEVIPPIPFNHSLRYATALGLALRRAFVR